MTTIRVKENEPFDVALRRFKRQCNYSGIFRLAKQYAHHEKRSDVRRREERERLRNIQIAERRRGSGAPKNSRMRWSDSWRGRRTGSHRSMTRSPRGSSPALAATAWL